jgi:hypothetical protein
VNFKTDREVPLYAALPLHRNKDGDCPGNERSQKKSSFLHRLSVSKFPRIFPRLYGLLFELRSFRYRIGFLWQRGGTRSLKMGPVFDVDRDGFLVQNKRTQARNWDIQKLLSDFPFLAPEDCHLFLLGWDAGSGFRDRSDREDSSCDTRHKSQASYPFRCPSTQP